MTTDDNAATVDSRGLRCQVPVKKARKAIKELPQAELLTELATDPAAPRSILSISAPPRATRWWPAGAMATP